MRSGTRILNSIWIIFKLISSWAYGSGDCASTPRVIDIKLMTWLDLTWLDLTWLDLTWLDLTWLDLTWLDLTWLDLTWLDLTWLDLTWLDLTWLYFTLLYFTLLYFTLWEIYCLSYNFFRFSPTNWASINIKILHRSGNISDYFWGPCWTVFWCLQGGLLHNSTNGSDY